MVFVLNKNKKPLNPCTPARARWLLKNKKAVVHKIKPFTIRLKYLVESPELKDFTLKIDPGSKTTGIAIVEDKEDVAAEVVFLANLSHRVDIKSNLKKRVGYRRRRRVTNLRYREPRFLNRTRPKGWLPPSIQSIVDNIESWTIKLSNLIPISSIKVETVRFDIQKMENPDISGIEYQQGSLYGYEVKEYLLHSYGHTCQYCKGLSSDKVLEVEHMVSKSNGGTNRLANLTLSCKTCNDLKGPLNLDDWLTKLKKSKSQINTTRAGSIEDIINNKGRPVIYTDAARVNSSRNAVIKVLSRYTDNLEISSGGVTKFNRINKNLPKEHYYDALCVGKVPEKFVFPKSLRALNIVATGRGSRARTNINRFGFPASYLTRQKIHFGYKTGDIVKAIVPKGKNKGTWIGKVAIRKTGSFKITLGSGTVIDGVNHKYLQLVQLADGYNYSYI